MRAIILIALAAALLIPGAAASAETTDDSDAKDIYIDLMSCPLYGSYKEVASAGGVTVWVYTCDAPPYPPEVAA